MAKECSNANDCEKLAKYLKNKMGNSIEFEYNVQYNVHESIVNGKYFHYHRELNSELEHLFEDGIYFFFQYCENDFLRISISDSNHHKCSLGEQLAVLSAFYEVLSEKFGEPLVFYILKDDDEQKINLQWSFINKEEDIKNFKNGTYFEDGEIDKLIIFGEQKVNAIGYQIGETARKNNSRVIGLPFDLFPLVEENMEDYVKYKTGKPIGIPECARMDSTPVALYENKITLEKTI